MANIFDANDAFEGEPREIVIGDFLQWKRGDLVSDYPMATHSMEYVAQVDGTGTDEIRIAATETSLTYVFSVASATAAAYVAGDYHWQLEVTETASGNRAVIDRGTWKVVADLDVSGVDTRSHAEIVLSKIEAVIEGKADADVSNYSIGSRSLGKMTWEELLDARDRYRAEVMRERAARGGVNHSTVKVYF